MREQIVSGTHRYVLDRRAIEINTMTDGEGTWWAVAWGWAFDEEDEPIAIVGYFDKPRTADEAMHKLLQERVIKRGNNVSA